MKLKSLDYAEIIQSFTNRYENIVKKMRFQQRQQQERDQRKVDMTATTTTAVAVASTNATHSETGSSSSTIRSSAAYTASSTTTVSSSANGTATAASDLSASLGAGKVRQMFDERRHGQRGAGIDKSYPLQPIQAKATVASTNSSNTSNGNAVANGNGTRAGVGPTAGPNNKTRVPPISANTKARLALQQRQQQQQQENGGGETLKIAAFDDNENLLDEEKFPDTISFDEDLSMTPLMVPMALNRKLPSKPSGPQNVNSLKLKPVPGRTPATASLKANATKSAPKKTSTTATAPPQSSSPSSTGARTSPVSSAKSSVSRTSTGKSTMATSASRKPSVALSATPSVMDGPVPDGLVRCTICSRNFADDRIAKHREICQKSKSKKRRVFDITKQRVAGTDAEKYVAKKKGTAGNRKSVTTVASSTAATGVGAAKGKSDWRRKHEEFIQAIRAAKEMQAHLAKGGKLSDLPPPPPSENPDYVQCPHCSRRFNQSAAERHIPKCATMLHNKKKPPTKAKRF